MKASNLHLMLCSRNYLSLSVWIQILILISGVMLLFILAGFAIPLKAASASNGALQETPQVHTLEIHYQNPAASEITLVWGVDGWKPLPEESWPVGTELRNGNMHTPMTLEGDRFVFRVQLPAWTRVDFGFLTTRDKAGVPVNIWEVNGDKDFQTVTAETDTLVDIKTALLSTGTSDNSATTLGGQLLDLDIQYTSPTSGEVFLVWGVDGWLLAPEEQRPPGTVVKEEQMHTPMLNDGDSFVARVQVTPGTVVDFGFLTTKDGRGTAVEAWEANGDDEFHETVSENRTVQIQSQLKLEGSRDLPSILVVGLYVLIGLIFILIVGFVFRRRPE